MSVRGVTEKCYILALFVRDDGQRLLLGDGAFEFNEKLQHFVGNTMDNDTMEIQGNDGIILAGQVRRPAPQPFDGYIADFGVDKTQTEVYRRQFLAFFAKNHYYKVIYVFPDGSAIKRQHGFIVDPPEVKEMWQKSPEYHVSLNFEDVNYYAYLEDEDGEEIYGQSAVIPLATAATGGEVWDEYGEVWDALGTVWEAGSGGGARDVMVGGIDYVYPVWVVNGPVQNPTLENVTTGGSISFDGNITASQTLRVDMTNQTATLNGTNVIGKISGDWVSFAPGINRVAYSANNNDAPDSLIEWSEVVG